MRVRLAGPADFDALGALFARAYPRLLAADYPAPVLAAALPIITRAQPTLLTSGTFWVADSGAGLLGAGGWTAAIPGTSGTEPGRGNIRHVVTDDRATRQGIGRAILTAAMEQARSAGITWMHCTATLTAVPFYAALGFRQLRDCSVPLGPGADFPAVEMRRDI